MRQRLMLILSEFKQYKLTIRIDWEYISINFVHALFIYSTDTLIQQTIRIKFANCTVLTVAHRLHTIIDSDRVLVMDTGRAIEFDAAYPLLHEPSSIFKGMVEALGPSETERIVRTAREKYESLQKSA